MDNINSELEQLIENKSKEALQSEMQSGKLPIELKESLLLKHKIHYKAKKSKPFYKNRTRIYQIAAVFTVLFVAGIYLISNYKKEDISIEEFNKYTSAEDYFLNEELMMLGSNTSDVEDIEMINDNFSSEDYLDL